ncbi:MAG: hypothetical protein K2Q10_00695, partial [Rhodospirillales bacterium]|nr:hypothetical protein [Rhodospirillales bacterium]
LVAEPQVINKSNTIPVPLEHEPTLDEVKRAYLALLLDRYDGHRSKVAKALGVSERNTYRLIRRFGLQG